MSGKDIVIFLGGAVTGSLITYALLKKKHEQIIQEELDSIRNTYSARKPKKDAPKKTEKKQPDKRNITPKDVEDLLTRYAGKDEEEGGEDSDMNEGYQITQEEYGEIEEYMQIPLVFYADGTITDEVDVPLDDAEDIFFEDFEVVFKNTFVGDTDTLYFRNDSRKADYEIAFDHRTFEEAMN